MSKTLDRYLWALDNLYSEHVADAVVARRLLDELGPVASVSLVHVDELASLVVERTGGLTLHSFIDSQGRKGFCAHFGPEEGELGCKRSTLITALSHIAMDHTAADGQDILADDDPRKENA